MEIPVILRCIVLEMVLLVAGEQHQCFSPTDGKWCRLIHHCVSFWLIVCDSSAGEHSSVIV